MLRCEPDTTRARTGPAMIIAVDGPTASGKGTIAKALAAHFGLPHLDTGLLYRAVGRQCCLDGGDPDDSGQALAACAFPDSLLGDPELRGVGAVLLDEVSRLIDAGVLKTTLGEHFGVINAANLRRAHALIESGTARGKVVLEGF